VQRRRDQVAFLKPVDGLCPMALVVGEFKAVAPAVDGFKLWIRHMPDAPLLADLRTWPRIARRFAPMFGALDADGGFRPRLIVAALICARREGVCAIDSASAEGMAAFDHWTRRRGRPLHTGVRLGLVVLLCVDPRPGPGRRAG
jgi:hypothetical protein